LDYDGLLELGLEIGCGLLVSGAEIYRAEDSLRRLLAAYGLKDAQVFAIPNCVIAGATTPEGRAVTRLRRVPAHGTDLQQLELYNQLCRTLCQETPPLALAQDLLAQTRARRRDWSPPVRLFGHFLGAACFSLFFGGSLRDALCGGLCGLAIAVSGDFLDSLRTGAFFRTLVAAAASAALALILVRLGLGDSLDAITIGAFMVLTPGVALTNSMREIMAGDMVSGVSRLAEALLIATAIALSTGMVLVLGGATL
jgi:uncharacterized membrane protein YjjP (DUF1212 family)